MAPQKAVRELTWVMGCAWQSVAHVRPASVGVIHTLRPFCRKSSTNTFQPWLTPPPLQIVTALAQEPGGGARVPSLSVLHIYLEGWILSFSCAFAGWTRWYYWCIVVYFRFLATKALLCTLCHAKHFSFRNVSHGCGSY